MSEKRGEREIAESGKEFCAVNPHCLEEIVCLSDNMAVRASDDILDDRGTKLWAKGAPVSRALQEKMLRRRLQKPLEVSLDVDGGVTLESVVSDCLDLMKENPALEALGGAAGARAILRGARDMALPGPLKLLLTSTRENRKSSYNMGLAEMIISAGLAYGIGLGEQDAGKLILAALVHDIGEMYINPEYLEGKRVLRPDEWKHVVSHPCVGQAFLKEFTNFPAAVSECVLHHHERLDGSGYPFQLTGGNLSPLSKLISVADSVAAIVLSRRAREESGLAERVAVALRIVPEEFPRPAVSVITQALSLIDTGHAAGENGKFSERVLPTLKRIRAARLKAEEITQRSGIASRVRDTCALAIEAILSIDKSLRATGVYDLSQLDVLENDPAIMGEVCLVLEEVNWRLRNLARNVFLRTEHAGGAGDLEQVSELVVLLDESAGAAPA